MYFPQINTRNFVSKFLLLLLVYNCLICLLLNSQSVQCSTNVTLMESLSSSSPATTTPIPPLSKNDNSLSNSSSSSVTTTKSEIPTTTISLIKNRENQGKIAGYDNDDDESTGPEVATEKSTTKITDDNKKDSDFDHDDADEDDDDYEEENGDGNGNEDDGEGPVVGCDGKLSSFVRSFSFSSLVAEDYANLSDYVKLHGAHGHYKTVQDTISVTERITKWITRLRNTKDYSDAVAYVGSLVMDMMYDAEVGPQCLADFQTVLSSAREGHDWPLMCKCDKVFIVVSISPCF